MIAKTVSLIKSRRGDGERQRKKEREKERKKERKGELIRTCSKESIVVPKILLF